MPVTSLGALFDVNRLGDSSASAFKMGWFGLIFGLCFASQGLSSPFQTIFLPYTQPIYGYPWMGHRLPVIQRIEEYPPPTGSPPPLPEPVVVELETQFKCTEPGNFADPETCNWYYVCNMMSDGELRVGLLKIMLASFEMRFLFVQGFIFECLPGQHFDAEKKQCGAPTGEDCRHQAPVDSCADLIGDARTLCQERQGLPTSPVVIELEPELQCTEPGTFADPNSCNKYYNCYEIEGGFEVIIKYKSKVLTPNIFQGFLFDCPPTLLFNPDVKECDYAESVVCNPGEQTIDICDSDDLTEEQRNLCQNGTWKQFDHFRKQLFQD